jgi:hypothetical protein
MFDIVRLLKGERVSKIDLARHNLKTKELSARLREQERQRNRERDPAAAEVIDKVRELFGEARVIYLGPRRPPL